MATQQIEVKVVDKTKGALRGIDNRIKKVEGSLLSVNKVAGLAVAALGAVGGAAIVRSTIQTIRVFEDLKNTLITIEGDAVAAANSMKLIEEFTAGTTFQLAEVTNAFITFKNAGLKPTTEFMTNVGNIAAGMGKRIDDVARAVFNATTGEFEMLKQLGVKVKTEGDKLTVNFRGVAKEIDNDGQSIIDFIEQIGKTEFAGALERSANTLTGALSNLDDNVKLVQKAFGDGGFRDASTEFVKFLQEAVIGSKDLAKELGDKLGFQIFKLTKFLRESNFDMGMFIKGAKIAAAALGGAGLIAVLKGVTSGVKALTLAMARNPLGLLAVAAASVITYLSMENGLGKTLTQIFAVMNKVGEVFGRLGSYLNDVFSKVIGFIRDKFYDFADGAISVYNAAARIIPGLEEVDKTARQVTKAVGELATKGFVKVSGKIDEGIQKIKDYVNTNEILKKAQAEGANVLDMLTQAYVDAGVSYDVAEQAAREEYNTRIKGIPAYDDHILRLARIASGNNDVAKSMDQASSATAGFKTKLQNLIKSYDEYRFTTVEIFKKQQEDNFKIFSEALEKELLTQQQFDELKLASNKMLNEILQEQNAETTAKFEENMLKQINATLKANDAILSADQKNFLQKKGSEERQQKITNDRIEFEKKSELEKTQFAIGQASDMFTSLGQMNKQAFQAAKAFNIANAIMNTYMGATKALATYPPPFNFIAAAAVVASGLAQVSAIRSQQYTGRQRGGNLTLGQGTIVGEDGPELIVPKQPSTVIPREVAEAVNGLGGRGDSVTVNFNINTVDARGMDELLLERRGTITGIINQAMQSKGRRGIV